MRIWSVHDCNLLYTIHLWLAWLYVISQPSCPSHFVNILYGLINKEIRDVQPLPHACPLGATDRQELYSHLQENWVLPLLGPWRPVQLAALKSISNILRNSLCACLVESSEYKPLCLRQPCTSLDLFQVAVLYKPDSIKKTTWDRGNSSQREPDMPLLHGSTLFTVIGYMAQLPA